MIIKRIEFENFRPFYGQVGIDLSPTVDRNIILIGGRNGHGKTNFLLGIVWCLYGKLISDVDESFKAEIASNYSTFLNGVLNTNKKIEGHCKFSVKLTFHDVPYGADEIKSTIHIHRHYDTESQIEKLEIEPDDDGLLALSSDEEKQNFINDYLIPIEIAKFVFFDAEKISQIADLNVKQQAKLLDNTLSNMLGLSSYQNLANEMDAYVRKLKKESAENKIKEQITNFENAIKSSKQSIETKQEALKGKNTDIRKIEADIVALETEINRRGGDNTNIETLHKNKAELEKQRDQIQVQFNDMADIMPLFILSGLMQEAKEHLEIETNNKENKITQKDFSEKIDLFIEELFNKGITPEPDINMKQKIFYAKKSEGLAPCFIDDNNEQEKPLSFTHNLDLSKANALEHSYKYIQSQSNANFIDIIINFTKTKKEMNKLEQQIKKLEISSADEITKESINDKNKFQNEKDKLNKEIGSIESDISKLETEQSSANAKLIKFYEQAKISQKNKAKIELSEKYIKVFNDFIKEEKEQKKEAIKEKLLAELKNLWNKELVTNAKLNLLPNDNGLEVELLNKNGDSVSSKNLSKGEQQLYISALLKAILDNSIHDLPILIDTPLARLDSEHRNNILHHYYPNLSTQVVVFSTDTEVTPKKYEDIKEHVMQSYLITNENNKSSISLGYFK